MLQRARRSIGIALMAASLALGVVLAPTAVAEEEVPEDTETVETERTAYYSADQDAYADNAVLGQFPPEAICLVEPRACFFPQGEEDETNSVPTGGVTSNIPEDAPGECATDTDGAGAIGNTFYCQLDAGQREVLKTAAESDTADEPNTVPPGSLPVSVIAGQPYHRSALEIELPDLAEGEMVDSFTMVLTQGSPTYANESPAFRQAVLAALTCAREDPKTPVIERCTLEEFEKIPAAEARSDEPLIVEACPITDEWEEGEAQNEEEIPEADCLFAASGSPVEGSDAWVFDLTFAAQAWYDGQLEYNGLLLRPSAAENFAFGDPETTYSKQVTFDGTVEVAMESSEGFGSTDTTDDDFSTDTTEDTTSTAPPPSTSTSDQGPPESGTSVNPPSESSPPSTTTEEPAVSQPESSAPAPEEPAPAEEPQTLAAGTPLGEPDNPWWLWLLVIPFLGGAYMLTRSLEETAGVAAQRSGAMTRLLERQAAARSGDLVTG